MNITQKWVSCQFPIFINRKEVEIMPNDKKNKQDNARRSVSTPAFSRRILC